MIDDDDIPIQNGNQSKQMECEEHNNQQPKMETNDQEEEMEEVVLASNIISLRCPLSFVQIEIPIKGMLCKHSIVVNAQGLIEYCLHNNYWNCPLCEKKCYFSTITVDRKLMEIIEKAPKDCSNVELDPLGNVVKYINDTGDQCENSEEISIVDD